MIDLPQCVDVEPFLHHRVRLNFYVNHSGDVLKILPQRNNNHIILLYLHSHYQIKLKILYIRRDEI